ncbi:hypothetical protein SS50377_20557 [Spironucleus salmonicida]|uniref:Uncharacterized protein n=1 Tax=Spironucleus salmonicida TaxID=348837 RepID=V6LV01_9EUKA|nr:hypothetical protein SS50377_20557 [Spironucleus salmonicida]|eukprot:EST48078.1 hypothetical protein SS50377_11775 [Spironucleus salmonicida]
MFGLVILAMPMMGGKGGKGGSQKFDTLQLTKGSYNITKTINNVPTQFIYEGKPVQNNETKVVSMILEKVQYNDIISEDNVTTFDRQVINVKNIIIETDNNTHLRIIKDEKVLIDTILVLDNKTTTYIGTFDIYRIVVHNNAYLTVDYFVDGTSYHLDIARIVDKVEKPWYSKLIQPGMLVVNMFITMKMKNKNNKQVPAALAQEVVPEDNDGTQNEEHEEVVAEESVAKKSKKAKKVE